MLIPDLFRDREACRPLHHDAMAGHQGVAPCCPALEAELISGSWPLTRRGFALCANGAWRAAPFGRHDVSRVRLAGFAPASSVWKTDVLLLDERRINADKVP